MDMEFKGFKAKKRNVSVPRVRWWNLTRENATRLSDRIKSEASWKVTEDSDAIREGMAQCIRRSAKEFLGISRRGGGRKSEVWWQNEEVRERVKDKQNAYAALSNSTSEEEKEVMEATYKAAKKLAKNNAFERLYRKLGTREGEKDVFKLARLRERRQGT